MSCWSCCCWGICDMSAIIISNSVSFGQMTNQVVARLVGLHVSIGRLSEAIATASSGYEGVPGTEFEIGGGSNSGPALMPARPGPIVPSAPSTAPSLWGVYADPERPGAQGQAYSYAVGRLRDEWQKFWSEAERYIQALDNGVGGL